MIHSMTGFGAARRSSELGEISVDIRSVNNRYLDTSFRGLRDAGGEYEAHARKVVREHATRGKVDVTFKWDRAGDVLPRLAINNEALDALVAEVTPVAERLGVAPVTLLGPLPSLPGVIETVTPDVDTDLLTAELDATLVEALERFDDSRAKEGAVLADDMLARSATLRAHCREIEGAKSEVVDRYRQRLSELAESLTESARQATPTDRLETEIALYADRCDITEELVRLGAHLDDLDAKLRGESEEPVGKALEFLVQEILRETNTIGSKARDTSVAQAVLSMKREIEKIREQVMNLE